MAGQRNDHQHEQPDMVGDQNSIERANPTGDETVREIARSPGSGSQERK